MINTESFVDDLFYDLESITVCETLPPEFDPIQSLKRVNDPYAISRKWFVYDDSGNEERYNEDW